MAKGILMVTALGVLVLAGSGCGIKARAYVAERERVDQANTGNAGFVKGEGSSMAGRKTRKVYVVEFEREKKAAKPAPKPADAAAQEPSAATGNETPGAVTAAPAAAPLADNVDRTVTTTADGRKVIEYTVAKDDTLQKISKKFYNSYNQWAKIYEANKDRIKNPNFVKPGTVLQIPAQ